jgi:hypothetical protein
MVINIAIKGGLGNQLFQYALGSYLFKNYTADIFYDVLPLRAEEKNLTQRTFLLSTLFSGIKFTAEHTHHLFYSAQDNTLVKWYKKFFRVLNRYTYISETHPARLLLKNKATYYLDGYWQRADLAKLLINPINNAAENLLKNNRYADLIRTSGQTVAIHIRRGDYISNAFINEQHGSCNLAYYLRAMACVEEKVNVDAYFIFSDDLAWAKENITSTRTLIFVEGHADAPVTDLLLMKSCHHQIISNSSFSCWASYLNVNPHKLVVAPVNWTRKEKTNELPLFEHTWMLI